MTIVSVDECFLLNFNQQTNCTVVMESTRPTAVVLILGLGIVLFSRQSARQSIVQIEDCYYQAAARNRNNYLRNTREPGVDN